MNLNETSETIAIVKAALRVFHGGPFVKRGAINCLQGTKYWPKGGKLNRAALLEDLNGNPWVIRNIFGVGEQTETEIFCHLLATVGEK
jgi:hypothetical protein